MSKENRKVLNVNLFELFNNLQLTFRYQAASPDENALIKSAKSLGFVFCVRTPDTILVDEVKFSSLNLFQLNILIEFFFFFN